MYSQRPSPYVVSFFCRHGSPNVGVHCSNEIPSQYRALRPCGRSRPFRSLGTPLSYIRASAFVL